jgi:integrase
MTLREFSDVWKRKRGYQLVGAKENGYRLGTICDFVLPASRGIKLGDEKVAEVTASDVEAFRHSRASQGLSVLTTNHDLKLLRKMFAWGVRDGLVTTTPFRTATGDATIKLGKEPSRSRRLEGEEQEKELLKVALGTDPLLHAVIVAMLETCCRPGEILTLRWKDVDLLRREIRIRGANAKDREDRMVPITARLAAILEIRRNDAGGQPHGPEAFVFGDGLGRSRRSLRDSWERTRMIVGLRDFHLADLRHESVGRGRRGNTCRQQDARPQQSQDDGHLYQCQRTPTSQRGSSDR